MAVVRGDRIGESDTLNRVSREAHTFYAAFVSAVPDDFGRFRIAPAHIWVAMYPRRQPKPADLRWVLRMVAELVKVDAFLVYVVDGQQFGEVAKWHATGNLMHRCPEPPRTGNFTPHEHQGRCLSTAIARAKEWKQNDEASILINRLNQLKARKAEQGATGDGTEPATPVNPSIRQSVYKERNTDKPAPANPLVDRQALVSEAYALIPPIAALEDLDRTEVARKASTYTDRMGRTHQGTVNIAALSDDRLAHTVADLREWKRRLDGRPEPIAKAPPPPPRQSVDAKNTDAIKRAIERRQGDAGPGAGDRVPEGVVTDRKSLPPGS